MSAYHLDLNKAVLVFFPSIKNNPFVAQVMVKSAGAPNVGEIAAFFLAQHEITKAIESLLVAHMLSPLPPTVLLEGENYTLRGSRRQWKYGKGLDLHWGEQAITTCEDKWVFTFEVQDL